MLGPSLWMERLTCVTLLEKVHHWEWTLATKHFKGPQHSQVACFPLPAPLTLADQTQTPTASSGALVMVFVRAILPLHIEKKCLDLVIRCDQSQLLANCLTNFLPIADLLSCSPQLARSVGRQTGPLIVPPSSAACGDVHPMLLRREKGEWRGLS